MAGWAICVIDAKRGGKHRYINLDLCGVRLNRGVTSDLARLLGHDTACYAPPLRPRPCKEGSLSNEMVSNFIGSGDVITVLSTGLGTTLPGGLAKAPVNQRS